MSDEIGLPTKHRERHSANGFERVRKDKKSALTYTVERTCVAMIRNNLSEGERLALGLYLAGLHAGAGRPVLSAYDGMPSERAQGFSEHIPEQWTREAIAFQQYAASRLFKYEANLLDGISRSLCPQIGLPQIRWQALGYWMTNSKKEEHQEGSFMGASKLLSHKLQILVGQWRQERRLSDAVERRLESEALMLLT